ncbi:MAG: hypothetical protein HFH87_09315 [Lachnospiraceae bacterium]|nr:hypothetical protein [Lachnospiraceae bacterium]
MNSYKIKKTSGVTVLFTLLLALSGFRLLFICIMLATEELPRMTLIMAVVYIIIFGISLFMVIKARRCSLTLNEDGLVYIPPLGAPKVFSYSDLQKVSMGGRSYIIYTRDSKKLVTFDDFRTENASQIIAFLKAKGVPAEL